MKEVSAGKTINDGKVFIIRLPSFIIAKNYGSLTREAGLKDGVNVKDLASPLETVRTLKSLLFSIRVK